MDRNCLKHQLFLLHNIAKVITDFEQKEEYKLTD